MNRCYVRSICSAHDMQDTLHGIWVVADCVLLANMIGLTVVYAIYALGYATTFSLSDSYSIYDSIGYAPARMLLPLKLDTADDNATGWAQVPGGPGRWTLPTDHSGMLQIGCHLHADLPADSNFAMVCLARATRIDKEDNGIQRLCLCH